MPTEPPVAIVTLSRTHPHASAQEQTTIVNALTCTQPDILACYVNCLIQLQLVPTSTFEFIIILMYKLD